MSFLRCWITRLSVCVLLLAVVFACQTTRQQSIQETMNPPEMVFPLAELNKNQDSLDAMFQHIMKGQTAIIKIDEGYIFPLIFDLKNKAAEVDLNNNTIELAFKQDMFLSISKKAAKLSRDGRNWYDIKNLGALKKIFAYRMGSLAFSLSANSGDSVAIVMTITTDSE